MMNFLLLVADIDDLNKHVCVIVEKQSSDLRKRKICILLAFVNLKARYLLAFSGLNVCPFETNFPRKIDQSFIFSIYLRFSPIQQQTPLTKKNNKYSAD